MLRGGVIGGGAVGVAVVLITLRADPGVEGLFLAAIALALLGSVGFADFAAKRVLGYMGLLKWVAQAAAVALLLVLLVARVVAG